MSNRSWSALSVIPAEAGIQNVATWRHNFHWIPAWAGMTGVAGMTGAAGMTGVAMVVDESVNGYDNAVSNFSRPNPSSTSVSRYDLPATIGWTLVGRKPCAVLAP